MYTQYIRSPMNYMGGKYEILEHIVPCFPNGINNFVDLFTGGLNVGINVKANVIYANDQITYIIELYRFLQSNNINDIVLRIKSKIYEYNLTQYNQEGYLALRRDYNDKKQILDLFVLTCYSFNHQIRFNSKHEFNMPFGKERSSYNEDIESNLIRFCKALQSKNIVLTNKDFMSFDFSMLSAEDLVYCDPPYLITTGSYNDGTRGFKDWTIKEELQLLTLLDTLNNQGVYFALSNVLTHKGVTNDILIDWSKKYHVKYIYKTYSNCSYHLKDRNTETVEVLVTNYDYIEPEHDRMLWEL